MPATPEQLTGNAYAVLGVSSSVSQVVAHEMYWTRIKQLVEAERSGNPDVRVQIEALNAALAIVTNPERRAAYDADVGRRDAAVRAEEAGPPEETHEHTHGPGLTGTVTLAVIGSGVAWLVLGGIVAALALSVALTTILAVHLMTVRGRVVVRDAFGQLQLAPDASRAETDLAYSALTNALLSHIRTETDVIRRLEALDKAYVTAVASLAQEVEERRRRIRDAVTDGVSTLGTWTGQAGRWLGRYAAQYATIASGYAWRGLAAGGRSGARWARPAAGRAGAAVWQRARPQAVRDAAQRRMETRTLPGPALPPAAAAAEAGIDVNRRLGGAVETAPAPAPEPATPPVAAPRPERPTAGDTLAGRETLVASEPAVEAPQQAPVQAPERRVAQSTLVLESAAGARRIPIGERPLSIGSSSTCDLVLPEHDDVAPEHALIWQLGEDVVLHVVAIGAACSVNGEPSTWARLEDRDTIEIGASRLQIEQRGG